MKTVISQWSDKLSAIVTKIYYHLHQHPELSFQEKETSAFIEEILKGEEIPFRNHIGGYGIVAIIEGKNPESKTVGLRADMDALPIQEENDVPFRSSVEGVMHACGHDVHVACLLGVAIMMNRMRQTFDGTLMLIFQPGEERHPGGARLMLEDGIFDALKPDLMIAQHVNADIPCGHVAIGKGCIMAAADEFHITVHGHGGHGALPNRLNDTVLAASQIVVSLQQIVSRRSDPFDPTVLSIGKFIADGATNIIPDKVYLSGTLRTMNETDRISFKQTIRDIINNIATAYGCYCDVEIKDGYPCVINNDEVTDKAVSYLQEYLGINAVEPIVKRMTAEDFGFFSSVIPSTFYRLGIAGDSNFNCGGQHTSTFLIDEKALKTGMETMGYLALRFLEKE